MEKNKPLEKKVPFPIHDSLKNYLRAYNQYTALPISYNDMLRHFATTPLKNKHGEDTLWDTVYFSESDQELVNTALCKIYALLKTDGDVSFIEHLRIDRVDYCLFGNTKPFRVRIKNQINDNYDHFYIKRLDASRIYGLELENILSPDKLLFLISEDTLIEEHIAGIPGDDFAGNLLPEDDFDQIRIAKEFIKFNERCFIRLLGDMRAYNYIVDITPDIEGSQYRIRAIDFDQQSYEARKNFYLPQFFKENNQIMKLGFKHLTPTTVRQYQMEERSLVGRRAKNSKRRLNELLKNMINDSISFPDKIEQLKMELGTHHKTKEFDSCKNMGEIVLTNIRLLLQKEFRQSILEL